MSVACLNAAGHACEFGVMTVDADDRIVAFDEKPAHPSHCPTARPALASMGIYAFDAAFLVDNWSATPPIRTRATISAAT